MGIQISSAGHLAEHCPAARISRSTHEPRPDTLPPYSPELNLIEAMWRHIKHEEMPVRSHSTAEELKAAVDATLERRSTAVRLRAGAVTRVSPAIMIGQAHSANSLSEAA